MTGVPDGDRGRGDGRRPRRCATLAKGAGVNRATFSAVAILAGPARSVHSNFEMLTLFDHVPENGARRLVQFWRGRSGAPGRAVGLNRPPVKPTILVSHVPGAPGRLGEYPRSLSHFREIRHVSLRLPP